MLPKELIDKLPSMDDLLEHPQVRSVAQSLTSSAVATRAREAIAHLTKEVSRQADQWQETSSSEFIDRLVGLIRQPEGSSRRSIINGTGKLHSDAGRLTHPFPDLLKNAIIRQSNSFTNPQELTAEVCSLLKDLTTAEQVIVASDYISAHAAVFADYESIVLARMDVGNLDEQTRLLDLAERSGLRILEAGTATEIATEELIKAAAESPSEKTIVYLGPESIKYFVDQKIDLISEFKEFKKSGARLVVALADSAPCDLPGSMGISYSSMQSACKFCADIVMACGDGLTGGPAVGLLVGESKAISACKDHLKQNRHLPANFDLMALSVILRLFQNVEQLPFSHPLMSLLDTPIDNIRLRAERFATLLRASEVIHSAEAVEIDGVCFAKGLRSTMSWGVEIQSNNLAKLFDTEEFQVLGNQKEDSLTLDLRTIFPREDQLLLDRFCAKVSD